MRHKTVLVGFLAVLFVCSSVRAAEEAQPEGSKTFVASTQSRKFHRLSCEGIKKIDKENQVVLESLRDAAREGYAPCDICHPEIEEPSGEVRPVTKPQSSATTPYIKESPTKQDVAD